MKRLILALLAAVIMVTAAAQTYNMEVSLKNGNKVTLAADSVSEVRFVKAEAPKPFNILTEEYIPDAKLRELIQTQVAKGEKTLTNVQAAEYTGTLDLDKVGDTLKGLEFFTGITELFLTNSGAEILDVRPFKNLKSLYFRTNKKLSVFNAEGLTKLVNLDMGYNALLAGYDLNKLPEQIESLTIMELKYESIDVSKFKNLRKLVFAFNQVTSLDVSNNKTLELVDGGSNKLTSVNVSGCSSLTDLIAGYNTELSNVNLAGCGKITDLTLHNTAVAELDPTPFASTLKHLGLGSTKITSLDVSKCTELEYLDIANTGVAGNLTVVSPKLNNIRCESSKLTKVDLSKCPVIREAHLFEMENVEEIILADDLSALIQLNVYTDPKLTAFSWGTTHVLQYGNICGTGLKRLDISKVNRNYLYLSLENENMTEIKVWKEFDIQNPPENIGKNETTKFVYEFTQE